MCSGLRGGCADGVAASVGMAFLLRLETALGCVVFLMMNWLWGIIACKCKNL
jgi:hypothetical protein